MNITGVEQRAKQFPWINITQTNFTILIFPIRLAAIYIIKRILIILCILEAKGGGGGAREAPHLDSERLHRSRRHNLWPRCRVC